MILDCHCHFIPVGMLTGAVPEAWRPKLSVADDAHGGGAAQRCGVPMPSRRKGKPAPPAKTIKALGLPAGDEQLLLSGNAARLLDLTTDE